MEIALTVVHIFIAVILVILVLIQDPKGGGLGSAWGGGGSNSVLGPMGAATLAQKMTRWVAVLFAATCLGLTMTVSKKTGGAGVVDSVIPAAAPSEKLPSGQKESPAGVGPEAGPKSDSAPDSSATTKSEKK
ncbi:MAG: preprotein translocase subunit SecG [Bdellovibrio sp.]